jgi:biopolymer transport protein ExbD
VAADRPVKVEIPITAMLDMSFQMLIFFIMNFNPSDFEGQMDMALPVRMEPAARNEPPAEPPPVGGPDMNPPVEVTVVVRTVHDGANHGDISQVVVRDLAGDTVVPNLDTLTAHLAKARDGLTNKEDVKIEGDSRLQWREVVRVMDAVHKAGFNAGFASPPDLPGR